MILLLALGYGGWRWWQSSQASSTADPPAAAQAPPVELETVAASTVQESSEFIGSLVSPQSVTISPQIAGRVSQIYVSEGDPVNAGDRLIQLSPEEQSANLASLQAAITSARAARANALAQLQSVQSERGAAAAEVDLQNQQYQRRQYLVQQGALAQEELDLVERDRQAAQAELNSANDQIQAAQANLNQAEAAVSEAEANAAAARERLQETTITAPFAGEVGNIDTKLGAYVNAGDTLTSVTQNNPLELELSVPVERQADLQTGLQVLLSDTQGNPITTGRVSFVSPQVNADAQSILAQASFPNADGQLRDGQDVRAEVIWNERPGILIPVNAVTRVGNQAFVYRAARAPQSQPPASDSESAATSPQQPQWVAQQVPVELGEIQDNQYPVLNGLTVGDRIVVTGTLNLSDGAPINPQAQDSLQIQDSDDTPAGSNNPAQ